MQKTNFEAYFVLFLFWIYYFITKIPNGCLKRIWNLITGMLGYLVLYFHYIWIYITDVWIF